VYGVLIPFPGRVNVLLHIMFKSLSKMSDMLK
jgi:hypothetical protein